MSQVIPVFYDPRMAAATASFSPSAGKPTLAVADWRQAGLPVEVWPVVSASTAGLVEAHAPAYVNGVLGGAVANGFGNSDPGVAAALPWSVGSLMTAAAHVIHERARNPRRHERIACSPSAGFHHAHYDRAEGYCTFNGLMVAAIAARSFGKKVGIIDCDYHYGNGTDDIISKLRLSRWVKHWSAGAQFRDQEQAEDMVRGMVNVTKGMHDCDLVLYQAGADQHINDPLGGLLTTEQMRQRDRNVFWTAREYDIPLVWNLAGGYQRDLNGTIEPVLALHRQTMQACVDIYVHGQGRLP